MRRSTMAAKPKDIPVIGLVGGIGAGKTTVAAELAALGCAVIDADALGHALLHVGKVRREVEDRWGAEVFDEVGEVNRSALATIVFADADELAALTAILYPRIRREIECEIAAAKNSGAKAIVLDAAVLFEAGWQDLCTTTVFVDAPLAARLERVEFQRGWDASTLAAREKLQFGVDKKSRMCDHILSNHASEPSFAHDIRDLLNRIVDSNHQ